MNRRVTPPKKVTSPTWGPPPPFKQALTNGLFLRLHIWKMVPLGVYGWTHALEGGGGAAQPQLPLNLPPPPEKFLSLYITITR